MVSLLQGIKIFDLVKWYNITLLLACAYYVLKLPMHHPFQNFPKFLPISLFIHHSFIILLISIVSMIIMSTLHMVSIILENKVRGSSADFSSQSALLPSH